MQKEKIMFLNNRVWESESEEPPEDEMEEIQQFHHSFFQQLDYLAIALEEAAFKKSIYVKKIKK